MAKEKMTIMPSVVLIVMTLWWLIPFFVRDLVDHPINKFEASYNYYWIIFATTLFVSILIFIFESLKGKWKGLTGWGKYFYCVGAYFLNSIIISMISTPSIVQIEYFGADPEGSVGMLFFPMAVLYFLSGAFIYFTIKAIKKFKKPSNKSLKRDAA
jgi:hypothetical protein